MKTLFLSALLCLAVSLNAQQVASIQNFDGGFVKNDGQIVNANGQPNPSVRFLYSGKDFNVALKETGFSYEGFSIIKQEAPRSESTLSQPDEGAPDGRITVSASRIDVTFKGANPHPAIIAEEPGGTTYNYYLSHRTRHGFTQVTAYCCIRWKNLYDGIDLVFLYDKNQEGSPIAYRFEVQAGADVSAIKMEFHGASGMALNAANDLLLENTVGETREAGLKAFTQDGHVPLAITRKIKGNTVSFSLNCPSREALVIDPNIVWSTYYGGNDFDYVGGIVNDDGGNSYIAGYTACTKYIATDGAYQTTFGGTYDIFVGRFNCNGQAKWATYLGGSESDMAYNLTIDNQRNVIVVGKSQSGSEITTPGAYDEDGYTGNAAGDFLVAKFTRMGALLWSTLIGGEGAENLRDVVCDSNGNIYTGGYTESAYNVKVSNKNPGVYHGGGDGWLAKLSPNGIPSWSTYIGGNGQDRIHGLALDPYGNVFVEGTTESDEGLATPGAYQTAYGGNTDAFIAKTDSTGNLQWATYYGGSGEDHGRGVVCDKHSAIYVTGYGASAHVFGTPGVWQENINSEQNNGKYPYDGYVGKFDFDGHRTWGSYYGGGGGDQLLAIDLADSSHVWVGGVTSSPDSIALPGAFQSSSKLTGSASCFAMFDSTGKLCYGSYIGDVSTSRIQDLAWAADNSLYLAVTTYGPMPVTPGTWQTIARGNEDCVLYRFHLGSDCFDKFEPDDSISQAYILNLPNDSTLYGYTAAISSPADEDWYKITTVNAKPNLKVTLTDLVMNYAAALYDATGNLIATSMADSGDQVLTYNGTSGASYFLHISHDSLNYDAYNCYRIRLYKQAADFMGLNGMRQQNSLEQKQSLQLAFYPNPVDRVLHISGQVASNEPAMLSIVNLMHQMVFSQKIEVQAGFVNQVIQLPDLTPGAYLFEWKQAAALQQVEMIGQ